MKRLSTSIFGEKKKYAFRSDFNIEECNRRLQGAVVQPLIETIVNTNPSKFEGRFEGIRFQLEEKRGQWDRSIHYVFYGEMTIHENGTFISGHFDLPFSAKFLLFEMAFFIGFWIFGVVFGILFREPIFIILLVCFTLGILFLFYFVLIITRDEQQPHILDFIQTTLLANPFINEYDKLPNIR
jgi:hypothetical protein